MLLHMAVPASVGRVRRSGQKPSVGRFRDSWNCGSAPTFCKNCGATWGALSIFAVYHPGNALPRDPIGALSRAYPGSSVHDSQLRPLAPLQHCTCSVLQVIFTVPWNLRELRYCSAASRAVGTVCSQQITIDRARLR